MSPQDRGVLLISAVRYALGRRTYIVSDTCRIVRQAIFEVEGSDRAIIVRDIRNALDGGPVGDACDEVLWRELLAWMDLAHESNPG